MTAPQTVAQADEAIKAGNTQEGERILKSILSSQSTSTDDAFLKEQEAALLRLGELYVTPRMPMHSPRQYALLARS